MTSGDSFEDFYTGAVSRLVGQLFLVTGDLHEAEEAVQEAFARASLRWSSLRDYNAPEAWVRRVAMNLAADRARKLRRQARALLRMEPPPEAAAFSVETLALVQALSTPVGPPTEGDRPAPPGRPPSRRGRADHGRAGRNGQESAVPRPAGAGGQTR